MKKYCLNVTNHKKKNRGNLQTTPCEKLLITQNRQNMKTKNKTCLTGILPKCKCYKTAMTVHQHVNSTSNNHTKKYLTRQELFKNLIWP